jgi:hypothetical protein
MVNLTGNPTLTILQFLLDQAMGANGPVGLNRLINVLTRNSGVVGVRGRERGGDANLTLDVAFATGTVQLTLVELNISGLNTWTSFNVLNPDANFSLWSTANIADLGVNLSVIVNMTFPLLGPPLVEEVLFQTAVNNGFENEHFCCFVILLFSFG